MKLVPENETEEMILNSLKPDFDVYVWVIQARAIMASFRLGVFEAIGSETHTADQIARKTVLNADALEQLLKVLVCAGYAVYDDHRYGLTELARNTLLNDSPQPLSASVEYAYVRWRMLDHLEEVIKTGKGVDIHDGFLISSQDWSAYQRMMLEMSRRVAREVAELVPVREDARKLLDAAGAHGFYGAMICRKHPPLCSVVFDLPEAVEQSRKLAMAEGIDDVVSFRSGNVLTDDFGGLYDVVFAGNICHHFNPDQNQRFFHRISEILTPGGTMAILGGEACKMTENPELFEAVASLMFRVNSSGQLYKSADYVRWAESAGLADLRIHHGVSHSSLLVTGRKA